MTALMLLLGVMGASIISLTQSSEHSYLSANSQARAYYLAESGLRYAQHIYCEEGWRHGRRRTLRLAGGDEVEVTRVTGNFWANAVVDEGTATQARALVPMPVSRCGDDQNNNADYPDDFAIFGEIAVAVGHNTIVQGDVAITDQDVAIYGNVNGSVLARNVTFDGESALTGDIFASGRVNITNGDVIGDIHASQGVTIDSESTVVGGWIFSDATVQLRGAARVRGHIHVCDGDLIMTGQTYAGTPSEPVEIRTSGNVVLEGSAKIWGDVHAGGVVTLDGGTAIEGNIYAGGSISGTVGTTFSGEQYPNSPTYVERPYCPDLTTLEGLDLPAATEFSAGGPNVFVGYDQQRTLTPGSYGNVSTNGWSGGNTELTLRAGTTQDANYYFESLTLGQALALRLDLSGTRNLHVFVEGDIIGRGALEVYVSTDGSNYYPMNHPVVNKEAAARVYWESASDFSLEYQSQWFGAVYTPEGNLRVAYGGSLIGSFYSGGGHNLAGTTVEHVTPNYFLDNE